MKYLKKVIKKIRKSLKHILANLKIDYFQYFKDNPICPHFKTYTLIEQE